MLSVTDIIKLLEQVPGWKAVTNLPKRLADLEARVKALESGRPMRSGPGAQDCPGCGARLTFDSETDHETLGVFGVKVHHLHCDGCGHKLDRDFDPKKGYGS